MTNRRFTLLTFAAVSLATALLPAAANAQGSIWDRIRDREQRERDDDRRNRHDDDERYGHRGRSISDYERRQLRDTARRINDRSRDLQRDIPESHLVIIPDAGHMVLFDAPDAVASALVGLGHEPVRVKTERFGATGG